MVQEKNGKAMSLAVGYKDDSSESTVGSGGEKGGGKV